MIFFQFFFFFSSEKSFSGVRLLVDNMFFGQALYIVHPALDAVVAAQIVDSSVVPCCTTIGLFVGAGRRVFVVSFLHVFSAHGCNTGRCGQHQKKPPFFAFCGWRVLSGDDGHDLNAVIDKQKVPGTGRRRLRCRLMDLVSNVKAYRNIFIRCPSTSMYYPLPAEEGRNG